MKSMFFSLLVVLFSVKGFAATLQLTSLTDVDAENMAKEVSANFGHHSIVGAGKLGDLWGFEAALLAGQTSSPELDKIVKKAGGDSAEKLYHGGLHLGLSIPFGLAAEFLYLPKQTVQDASVDWTSMALKWTFTDEVLTVIPFNMALRGTYSTSKMSFTQTTALATGTISNENKVTGLELLASPRLPIFEPYAGIGIVNGDNTVSYSGIGTIFADGTNSKNKKVSSTRIVAGLNAKLAFFSLGAEYFSMFGTNGYSLKLGLAF